MSLWDSVRGEMAGAWRSLCYDLGRPSARVADPRPDVTFTGMNTFPGSLVSLPVAEPCTDARPPRRFVAVATFCALAAGGAAGSYLVATTAFAGRMTDPPVIAAPEFDQADAGLGAVPAVPKRHRERPRTVRPAPMAPAPAPSPTSSPTSEKALLRPSGTNDETVPPPDESDCACEAPPVPTPTAPSPTDDPGPASPSASAEPSASEPSPSTTGDHRHPPIKPEISVM